MLLSKHWSGIHQLCTLRTHSTRSTHSPFTLYWFLSGFREKLWYDHYTCRRVNTLHWFSFLHNIDQEVTVGKFISGAPAHLSSSDWSINQCVTQCLRPQGNYVIQMSLTSLWPAMTMWDYCQLQGISKTFSQTGITCSEFTEVSLTGSVER